MEKYCAAGQAAADNIERRMHIACRMSKVKDTHSEHLIFPSFPRQKCLWESTLILRLYFQAGSGTQLASFSIPVKVSMLMRSGFKTGHSP